VYMVSRGGAAAPWLGAGRDSRLAVFNAKLQLSPSRMTFEYWWNGWFTDGTAIHTHLIAVAFGQCHVLEVWQGLKCVWHVLCYLSCLHLGGE
jgi:hypothetical protein